MTDAVIQKMHSYNDNDFILGPITICNEDAEEPDDFQKLESIFKRLIGSNKVSRKAVVQKLIDICGGTSVEEVMDLSRLAKEDDDASVITESRLVATEEQRHRHKVSNTNSNFYKFRKNPDRFA